MAATARNDGERIRPTYRPNPYRRAIANAIMLEQAWDRLAVFSHAGPPPFDRIVPQGTGRRAKVRMNLPRPLTDEALRRLHDERTDAVMRLHRSLAPTLGLRESISIDLLMEESCNAREAEQYHVVPRRRHVRSVDDEPDRSEDLAASFAKEADRPLSAPVKREERPTRVLGRQTRSATSYARESISIDLVVHSLIEMSGADRDSIHRELAGIRKAMSSPSATVELHSPSRRSNTGTTLRSLGEAFPPASFRLAGLSLDVLRIDLHPTGIEQTRWRYAKSAGRHVFTTGRRPSLIQSWNMPGRALAVALEDDRWHPSLVVESATDGVGSATEAPSSGAVITLVPARTHIDPPGSPAPLIHQTWNGSRAAPLDQTRATQWRHLDAVPLIEATLRRLGQNQMRRIEVREGRGLELRLAAPHGGTLVHRHPITTETIDDGNEAIVARVEDVVSKVLAHHAKKKPKASRRTGPTPVDGDRSERGGRAPATVAPDPLALLGADGVVMLAEATRTDALLADLLKQDPVGAEPELLVREGILFVASATLGKGIGYRLEKFDRTMGRTTHAIGLVEIDRALTASMVERLRDGAIGLVVPTWPAFAQSQVRRVTRDEISTIVTVRVPIVDRS